MFARRGSTFVGMTEQEERQAIIKNKGLVYCIARSFARGGRELDDLMQEGYIGLLEAARTYDHIRPWGVWAGCHIRWSILRYLDSSPPVETSLDAEGDDGEESLSACLADMSRPTPELAVLDTVELEEACEAIPDARAREVFTSSIAGESLSSIARRLGFSKQTAYIIIMQTIQDLRARQIL
jgi:RNA polymerase sigma factor (sigma-70 family)